MLHSFQQLIGIAIVERLSLVLNHILASEPVAVQRMLPHAGRRITLQLTGWPAALPALPSLAFTVTRAGLLEWCGPEAPQEADLMLTLDASRPARMLAQGLSGHRPRVDVAGDATLATDVSWLMDNLRWDVQDDLSRVVGGPAAKELARVGAALARGLREGVGVLSGMAARARGDSDAPRAEPPGR